MITESRVYTDYHRTQFKIVKNLGWLLKHRANVKEFRVYTKDFTNNSDGAILVTELLDDKIYKTGFASKSILFSWLKRSIFYELPICINGIYTTIIKDMKGV